MSDAAIKAALEAAGEAARKAIITPGCCIEGTGCEVCPCHCASVAASAAVAAFLRALPKCSIMLARDDAHGYHNTTSLAAAVEAAAREGE